jgi:glycosyltransferase involved in cell wall biosynthesis
MIAYATHLDRSRFRCAGTASLSYLGADAQEMIDAARRTGPIHLGADSLRRIAAKSDALVVWGFHCPEDLPAFPGPIVYISHGDCSWTRQAVETWQGRATHWAAVSRAAAGAFSVMRNAECEMRKLSHSAFRIQRSAFRLSTDVGILYNGFDPAHCRRQQDRRATRHAWGLGEDEIALGYLGRLSSEKDCTAAARAAAALGPPYRSVLVGAGLAEEREIADCRRLDPRMIHVPYCPIVGDAYAALDCFFMTSPSEGTPRTLLEAWYCGLPVVATATGIVPEAEARFGPLTVGVPFSPTGGQLAAAVRQALSPANRAVIDRARRIAVEHYTDQAAANGWNDYWGSLFATRGE